MKMVSHIDCNDGARCHLPNTWSCLVQVHHVVPFAVDGHQELLQLPH